MSNTTRPLIRADAARRLFLAKHGLADPPKGAGRGADLASVIDSLGFVQVDSINTVARAHHMILFARRPAYRESGLKNLLERDRQLFEHWTHDAAVIPTGFFPHWRLKFARDAERLRGRWQKWRRDGFQEKFDQILKRISDHGPVKSAEVGEDEVRGNGGWWDWHPSKTALEYLWRSGALAVCRRDGFQKVYDLTERVIPDRHLARSPDEAETIDWAAVSALDRLGFGTSGEIAAFFDLITPSEAKQWCQRALANGRILEVDIAGINGQAPRRAFMFPDILDALVKRPDPPSRIRVLSPFDPLLRDRKRAERLFGFHYRIEVFVPEPKRRYGYYVFPLLEADRLIGRIDMKAQKADGRLHVRAFWPERGVALGKGRQQKLEAELDRVARFAGCASVTFEPDWQRGPVC
ncbi:MAG: YcaQ family DNA glycosylase [Roseibium sp.]|nr:YcaQ family DNA glycosylase [Roseibium sp.]